jgi:hypothetical protein
VSDPDFLPGETAWVELAYVAGDEIGQELRSAEVEFREATAPRLRLVAKASVRRPLTVFPAELPLGSIEEGSHTERWIEIANYSGAPWSTVDAKADALWLTCQVLSDAVAESCPSATAIRGREMLAGSPVQIFRAVVRILDSQLSVSGNSAQIRFRSTGSDVQETFVPVYACRMPRVSAVPEEMFFGNVKPGGRASLRLKVIFAPRWEPSGLRDVLVSHTLDDRLNVQWTRTTGRVWEMLATLNAGNVPGLVDSKVCLRVSRGSDATLTIPVKALVSK